MIAIDAKMPQRCADCPCYGDKLYGKCQITGDWLDEKEGSWFATDRPSWCPLKELVRCKDCICKDNCRSIAGWRTEDFFCADGVLK